MTQRRSLAIVAIILAFAWLMATIAYAAPPPTTLQHPSTQLSGDTSLAFSASDDCGDTYEPNDTFSTAADIPIGSSIDAYICTATDVDFFKFDVIAGQDIIIDLTALPADYDLVLYDPDGAGVADSTNASLADEHIAHTATKSGQYRVRVKGYEGAYNSNSYTLKVQIATPTCGDAYEWNNSIADAYTLASQEIAAPLYICTANDEDWFEFNVSAGQIIDLATTSMPADYDLYLYNPAGDQVDESRQSGTADESISHTATASGWYRALVVGYNGAYDNADDYSLSVNVREAATATPTITPTATPANCGDPYEPNDSYNQAGAFPGNAPALHAFICTAGDEDWFKFDVSAGQTIDLHLGYLPANYDMLLYNPDGNIVGSSYGAGTGDEHITHTATASGSYAVRVFGNNNAYDSNQPYILSLQISSTTATPTVTPDPGSTPTPVRIYTPMILTRIY